jgi:hypothetical protein
MFVGHRLQRSRRTEKSCLGGRAAEFTKARFVCEIRYNVSITTGSGRGHQAVVGRHVACTLRKTAFREAGAQDAVAHQKSTAVSGSCSDPPAPRREVICARFFAEQLRESIV